jgi:hypothetical protein
VGQAAGARRERASAAAHLQAFGRPSWSRAAERSSPVGRLHRLAGFPRVETTGRERHRMISGVRNDQ